jgi:hypothetical protein
VKVPTLLNLLKLFKFLKWMLMLSIRGKMVHWWHLRRCEYRWSSKGGMEERDG